ncbi:hypothetical protein [Pseudomonas sp. B11(2017)]|uniref:hypothetical protein n=1 Tax=Pseudomonas sp. B11(2017) TaxID=1981748 RepID=UPI00353103D8
MHHHSAKSLRTCSDLSRYAQRHKPFEQRSRATVSFAPFQALAGFASSALFEASGGNHALLCLTAAGSLAVALLLELAAIGLPYTFARHRCLS